MAGNQYMLVGAEVPILLQIADGANDQYPQAEIRDNGAALLATYNLVHQASGIYVPALPYSMPDESFIKVTYIVYEDVGHLVESSIYERDIDVFYQEYANNYMATGFATENPPSQNLNDYKADVSGLSPAGEYSAALTVIQNEVDGLDGEAMRGTDSVPTNPLLTNDVRLNHLDVAISTRSFHGDPTSGIKGAPGKTLEEVYNNERGTDGAYTGMPPTPTEIDVELTANHGADSWQEGGGMSEADLHDGLDSYTNKNGYKADVSGVAPAGEYDTELAAIQGNQELRNGVVGTIISTTEFETDLSEGMDGYWNRGALKFTSGQNEGVIRKIQTYTAVDGILKLRTAPVYPIVSTDTFAIIPLRCFRLNHNDVTDIESLITTSEGNIRGGAADTLETLSDQIDMVEVATGQLTIDVAFIKDIEGGRWYIDAGANQMVFLKADNVTEVARFDLKDTDGLPATEDVFERRRV